jgi:uncharacterized protein (TIGR03083 family)
VDREQLLVSEEKAWRSLLEALTAVPPGRRSEKGVVPGWSTHDLAWHCVYWADFAGEVIERIHGGDPDPADSDLTEEQIIAVGRTMAWDEILRHADRSRKRVRTALASLDELTPKTIEWFEGDTFVHYDEHAEQIRVFSHATAG